MFPNSGQITCSLLCLESKHIYESVSSARSAVTLGQIETYALNSSIFPKPKKKGAANLTTVPGGQRSCYATDHGNCMDCILGGPLPEWLLLLFVWPTSAKPRESDTADKKM